ncbi:MAG: histidine--tRNA ligase [Euryarchaeota archaeon]|nr:histidine--tRNA ligase [Euryarchaeota archaeon]MDE1834999.1 histidine--tRNA ligase [Euryarchaeota archaeon]
MPFQALRGFRDYLPADAAARRAIFDTVRSVTRRYGFDEVETPSVESLELFKVKSGEGIVDETFSFKDKGGREVTLVPEITPSVARIYVDRAKIEPLPVKWFSVQRLWRYEEPQSGRTREFSQVNLDILGVPGVEGELEVLAVTRQVMEEIGLGGRYVFRTSDRRLVEGLGRALGAKETDPFFRALDRREKLPSSEFQGELAKAGLGEDARGRLTKLLTDCGPGLSPKEAPRVLEEVRAWPGLGEEGVRGVEALLELFRRAQGTELEEVLVFYPSLVRGLAYYTSTVFEAWARTGEVRALFGGGRYDKLVELFGGPSVPACGLAIGDQTLEILMREAKIWPERPPGLDVYVATVDPSLAPQARTWAERLRKEGFLTDYDLLARPLSRQMKEGGRRGARSIVLLGPRELAKGEVTLRNMRTGQQVAVASGEVVPLLKADADVGSPSAAPARSPARPSPPETSSVP